MHESAHDIEALDRLLVQSRATAGGHLRSIFTEERHVGAAELCGLLTGVCVLALATITAAGEPRVAPVDGLFYRGEWYFGSSKDSVRYRHLLARPAVSATYTRGEELAVVAHGRAELFDVDAPEHQGFRSLLIEIYGPDWEEWAPTQSVFYARLAARKMFSFRSPLGA